MAIAHEIPQVRLTTLSFGPDKATVSEKGSSVKRTYKRTYNFIGNRQFACGRQERSPQGRRWTSDTQGLRLAEETDPPHKSTKLNSVPLTWLVWTSAATALITVIPIMLYFAIL
ncbi:hypothetical protein ACFV98_35205 [Streptomyces violascens]|uniref:hypothetical protein n=1 Tax=Streptomyces violascens TaxID=67381 RepID=UPI0036687F6F